MPYQVIVQSSIEEVDIIDTPIPTPDEHEIVIRVIVSGSNPKDWKYPFWKDLPHNSGDDIAGIVHAVGESVFEFRPGDRVAACHEFGKENGSYAQYAVAPDWTTFHIPPNISFEEAATVPVAAFTAIVGLYADLKLTPPWELTVPRNTAEKNQAILIYGITSGVGAFAAKFARLSGFYPIIGVAGRASEYAGTLADHIVDYRIGEDALVKQIEDLLAQHGLGKKVPIVFDAISEGGTLETVLRFLDPDGGKVCNVLPTNLFARDKANFKYPVGITAYNAISPRIYTDLKDIGYLWARYFGRLLQDGRLKGHPYSVIPGGLNGVLKGLQNLRDGKASAVKYVYRVEDTGEVVDLPPGRRDKLVREPRKNTHPLRNFPFPAE